MAPGASKINCRINVGKCGIRRFPPGMGIYCRAALTKMLHIAWAISLSILYPKYGTAQNIRTLEIRY